MNAAEEDQRIARLVSDMTINVELIVMLEDVLERARKGEVLAAVICGEQTGREVFTALAGDFDVFRMLGAIEYVKSRVLHEVEPG